MSLIKTSTKLPKEVAAIFHELVSNGVEKSYAARKAWGMVKEKRIEITPMIKTIAKETKKIDNGIQGSLFNREDYTELFKRTKK